ncbi:MAG: hypothetical protein QG626_811, partial [Patescibacteria group bacterium]|nr:hypothetical protein [Patescibacteria group bacterium]
IYKSLNDVLNKLLVKIHTRVLDSFSTAKYTAFRRLAALLELQP